MLFHFKNRLRWLLISLCLLSDHAHGATNQAGWSMDIYGERNSGTNWATVIAAKNVGQYFEDSYNRSPSAARGLFREVRLAP